MISKDRLTLYYSPQTRATGARILLEELGAPYDLHVLNMKAGEQRQPAFLAVNPLGKVPVIRHGEALVSEQVAIFIYLADLFPEAGLTPALDDPRRGPYLRWIAYYGSSFEPALIDHFMKRDPAPPTQSPYSDYDSMLGALETQLAKGPYLLGDRITAADILWGRGVQLDDDVRPRATKGRIFDLRRAHHVASGVSAYHGCRCRDGRTTCRGCRRVTGATDC